MVLKSNSWSLGQTNNWTHPACFPLSFWSHQGNNINPWQAQHVLWVSIKNLRWSTPCLIGLELTMYFKLVHKHSLNSKLAQWASNSKSQLLQGVCRRCPVELPRSLPKGLGFGNWKISGSFWLFAFILGWVWIQFLRFTSAFSVFFFNFFLAPFSPYKWLLFMYCI